MKIIFMGTPSFAVPCLDALHNSNHELLAVVTVPDKPAGRGLQPGQSAVKQWAVEHKIKLFQPADLKSTEFLEKMRSLAPDLFVVVAFRILPRELFSIPKSGAFNLHASLLPKYRGAAPINWAIINDEKETGVTTFFLQDKVDTGAIILQKKISIGGDETAGELHDRLARIGATAIIETIDRIAAGNATPLPQDNTLASAAPKLTTEICRIAWTQDAQTIHNHVRGLSPYPGAWTTLNGKTLKILRTKITDLIPEPACPGECVIQHGGLFIKTESELLELLEVQLQARAKTSGAQFVQGRGINAGAVLE